MKDKVNRIKSYYWVMFFFVAILCILMFIKHLCYGRGPKLLLNEPTYNLGELVHDERIQVEMGFKNNGSDILIIEKILTNCGCVSNKLEKKEYQPGEAGKLSFEYWAAPFLCTSCYESTSLHLSLS